MRKVSTGTVLRGFSCRPSLAPTCAPLGPPVKIQQAIHRFCAYSCLKRPHQKLKPAAPNVSLGVAQQGAPDSPRTHLNVAWVELRIGGGGVSGNPLGRVTSVIQFDDISAMAELCPHTGRWKGSTRNNGYHWHFCTEQILLRLSLHHCFPVSPW